MRRGMIYLSVALLLLSLGLTLIPYTFCQTQSNIKTSNFTWHVDPDGYVEVVGEVQNVGNDTLEAVYLAGSVLTTDGFDLGDSSCQTLAWYLLPGQKAPFSMEFEPKNWSPTGIGAFNVTGVHAPVTTGYQYQGVKILSSSGTIGTNGNFSGVYMVNGFIQNTGNLTAEQLSMVATYYDKAGAVVAIGYNTTPVADSLSPSEKVAFQVPSYDVNQTLVPASEKIASYSLAVIMQNPILNGTRPTVTAAPTQTSSVSTPPPSVITKNSSSLNPTLIWIIILIAIVVLVGTIVAFKRRKSAATKKINRKSTRIISNSAEVQVSKNITFKKESGV